MAPAARARPGKRRAGAPGAHAADGAAAQHRLGNPGAHLAAIQSRGLEVRTLDETFVAHPLATDVGSDLADADYVIVAVKGYSLPDVGPVVAAAASAGATIVPLLNGIDVAERLSP